MFITDHYDRYSNPSSDNWMRDHGTEEQKLPGFNEFSQRQMFWISYAQMYCSKWTDDGIFKLVSSVSMFVIYIVEHFKIENNIRKVFERVLISKYISYLLGCPHSRKISDPRSSYE